MNNIIDKVHTWPHAELLAAIREQRYHEPRLNRHIQSELVRRGLTDSGGQLTEKGQQVKL